MSQQCRGNCGFFGNPETGYCSKCGPKFVRRQSLRGSFPSPAATTTTSSVQEQQQQSVVDATTTSSVQEQQQQQQQQPVDPVAEQLGKCRTLCGFHSSGDECLGCCSMCFKQLSESPLLLALVAAASNNAALVEQYVRSEAGRSTRDQITASVAEAARKYFVFVELPKTLLQVAVERGAEEVLLMMTTLPSEQDPGEDVARTTLSFAFNEEELINTANEARDEFYSSLAERSDGLRYFAEDNDVNFFLPREASLLTSEQRKQVLGLVLELGALEVDIRPALDFAYSNPGTRFVALYTPADLNCLMHSALLATVGVRDTRVASSPGLPSATLQQLRGAVHAAIVQCRQLQQIVAGDDRRRLNEIIADIATPFSSLDGAHVFALANVMRRPIIVYAAEHVEGKFRATLTVPFRVSGVYLPLLWPATQTSKEPILICFSSGHFSATIGFGAPGDLIMVPLADESLTPLPAPFVNGDVQSALESYLLEYRNVQVKCADGSVKVVPHCSQTCSSLGEAVRGLAETDGVDLSNTQSSQMSITLRMWNAYHERLYNEILERCLRLQNHDTTVSSPQQ